MHSQHCTNGHVIWEEGRYHGRACSGRYTFLSIEDIELDRALLNRTSIHAFESHATAVSRWTLGCSLEYVCILRYNSYPGSIGAH